MDYLLRIKNISYIYHSKNGETLAVEDIGFEVKEGEFICLVGPSGCGKSTVLSMIAGLLKPRSGDMLFNGRPLENGNDEIAYMLQRDHLFGWRTIKANAILGLEIRRQNTPENIKGTVDLLTTYGLGNFINSYPSQLSGGMRQKAALIRTLAVHPSLLLLDEPFSALDYQTRLAVADEIYSIIKRENKTAIMVTHDIAEAISMADRVFVLSGRPARIKRTIELNLSGETPLNKRQDPNFKTYFDQIWKELDIHVT